jgi:tetratricopeptide (TPR) repeat protein
MTSSRKRTWVRPRRSPILRRALVMGVAVCAFVAAVAAWFTMSPTRLDPEAARELAARSTALLQADNATAARTQALAAVRSDPGNAEAHVALAKAMLALDEGTGAEAELQRAAEAGYDPKLLAHLRAHALLLQGQEQKALAQADKAAPQFRAYGLRMRGQALAAQGNHAGAQAALDEAVRIAGRDADVWVDIGRFRLAAGDMLGAIEAGDRAVKLDGGNVDALVLRGELVRTQFGLVAALPWFEAALKRDAYRHDALVEYAATLGDAGRTVESLAAARRAMEARPGSPQGFYLQAVIAARAGDPDLARSVLEKAGDAVASVPGGLLLAGTLDIEAGAFEQAIGRLGQLVAGQPMNIAARKLLAVALLRTDSARNAIDVMRPVVARSDADSYSLSLVARGFERIGDRANAARYLDRAAYPATGTASAFSADDSAAVLGAEAAERPGDPQATIPLIRALADRGDKSGALAMAQNVARRNAGAPAAHLLVGDMLMLMERPVDAAAVYRHAADLRFDEPVMLRLVEALDRADRRGDAANVLALFLSQNPVNVAALRLSAHWQLAGGDHDSAIDTLERLRQRIGDGDAALNAELAVAYAGAGETQVALDFGEAAYALAPANPAVADAFGWALFQSGDNEGALELLQKAVRLAPRHAGLRWHLAQVYAELNRKPEARLHAQAALADPRFAERAAAAALAGQTG